MVSLHVDTVCVDVSMCFIAVQDLHDRMKKEAKREMEDRGVLEKDEAAAAREDEEFKVHARITPLSHLHLTELGAVLCLSRILAQRSG